MLDGFDVVALHMNAREDLANLRERCALLGVACSPIQDRAPNEAVVDVTDPDGTVLRFYWVGDTTEPDHFVGVQFDTGQAPTFTTQPRLQVPAIGEHSHQR